MAPDGDDLNPGTAERPFASLAGARDAVRNQKEDTSVTEIKVWIHGGTYRISRTVRFGLRDSAAEGQKIIYAAFPGETPAFTSAMPVTSWSEPKALPPGMPPRAEGKVKVAALSDIIKLKQRQKLASGFGQPVDPRDSRFVYTVYRDGHPLKRARGPGFRPAARTPRRRGPDQEKLVFPRGAVRNWSRLRDAELLIVPCSFWIMNILPFKSVSETDNTAAMLHPGTYSLGQNSMTGRSSCWVENIPEYLDGPGTWYFSSEEQNLYLWSENTPPRNITVPVLTELIRVEGDIDYSGLRDIPVRGITFRGLTFRNCERLSWHGNTGWGLQHDWEMFDRPTAMIRFRGAEQCSVEECTFSDSAHSAVRLDLHARQNQITANHIHNIGGVGILLAGYGPGTKDVNRDNLIMNNYIHHTGLTYWGSPAVFVWQSGNNRIVNNTIHHTPYTSIVVSGRINWNRTGAGECSRTCRFDEIEDVLGADFKRPNWSGREPFLHARNNLVARNDLSRAMEVTGDGNTIYVSGCGRGNIVRENYCHDCFGQYMNAVLRNDDDQHGSIFERNICTRTRGHGEGVINKGANKIIENIFADLRPGESHHRGYVVLVRYPQDNAVISRNVIYSCREGQITVGESPEDRRNPRGSRLRDCVADYNLYECTVDPDWGKRHLEKFRTQGIERNSRAGDPLFVDPANDDFKFREGSPAIKMGIAQPIDVALTGVQPPYRSRWFKPRMRTIISPRGKRLRERTAVSIQCSHPDARIHYTLDGSEPTRQSPKYSGPLEITRPCVLSAKSFSNKRQDIPGDRVIFTPPPQPIRETFENLAPGSPAPRARTQEENKTCTARVTDETASRGNKCLKFTDGSGQKYPFNPHINYKRNLLGELLVCRFSIKACKTSVFSVQCRQYPAGKKYLHGPRFDVRAGGKVLHDGKPLTTIPVDRWVTVKMSCPLRDRKTGKFTMNITVPGRAGAETFQGLTYDPAFEAVDWLGFISLAREKAVTYIDDIELLCSDRIPEEPPHRP